jgi:predicted metal-dependent phosphoesterase TrpH
MGNWRVMLIDLHAHTSSYSMDSNLRPEELIEGSKAAGLDGICITEHDFFWDAEEVRELSRRHDFLLLPGCEITTEEGHMLVFGLERYVFGMHRVEFLERHVSQAGGAMLAAHPYRRNFYADDGPWAAPYGEQVEKAGRNIGFRLVDGVETLNGRGSPAQNQFSQDVCERQRKPAIGASDSHVATDIGTCATEFETAISGLGDLITELKAGRFRPVDLRSVAGGG